MKPEDLNKHPEGGRFREVFRSVKMVTTGSGNSRTALTHIYFSLQPGEVSRFHRLSSDEVWNLYRGPGIRIFQWDGTGSPPVTFTLTASNDRFCHVIPAGMWQAAEPLSDAVLAGCSVAPGFEFADFQLMEPGSEPAERLVTIDPEMAKFTAR